MTSPAQDGEKLLERRVRVADVDHHRQFHGLRCLPRQVERAQVVLTGNVSG